MKYKTFSWALICVSLIICFIPHLIWNTNVDSDEVIYLDATLTQKVKCFDENGQVALCTITVNEFDNIFLLNDWQIVDIDLLNAQNAGDTMRLGIKKDNQKYINQSSSLILISAETANGSVATLESYQHSSDVSKCIISSIGFSGVIIFSLILGAISIVKKYSK